MTVGQVRKRWQSWKWWCLKPLTVGCSLPGPPNRWFLVVFGYLKASRNHLLGGIGMVFLGSWRFIRWGCQARFEFFLRRAKMTEPTDAYHRQAWWKAARLKPMEKKGSRFHLKKRCFLATKHIFFRWVLGPLTVRSLKRILSTRSYVDSKGLAAFS